MSGLISKLPFYKANHINLTTINQSVVQSVFNFKIVPLQWNPIFWLFEMANTKRKIYVLK